MRLKLFNLLGRKVKSVSSWLDRQINEQLSNIPYWTNKRDKRNLLQGRYSTKISDIQIAMQFT